MAISKDVEIVGDVKISVVKASDLMIGDLVYDSMLKTYGRIEVITPFAIQCDIHTDTHHIDFFKPIPLTEEILEANGFEETNVGFMVKIFERHSYTMKLNESGYYGIEVVGGYCNIRAKNEEYKNLPFEANIQCNYVHELQHALRLCGLNELADNFKIES